MIICYTAPEIWCVMDIIVVFHFGQFFALFLPIFCLEISSFYTILPKIIVIGYTVPETWRVMDVIIIFYFGLSFTPLTVRKMKISKK